MGNPVTIEDRDGEPEPDAGVYRGSIRDVADRPRTPAEAALLAEVSHSSYDYDRYAKWVTYAAARVPVYWIVDLNRRRLEVHTEPTGQGEDAVYCPHADLRPRRRGPADPRRPRGRSVPREGDLAMNPNPGRVLRNSREVAQ